MLATVGAQAVSAPALARQPGGQTSAEQHDIGRVETRIQRYDQALGVIAQLTRPLGAEVECNGICYFPSSTRPASWRCAPKARCDLHCDVNPPVGGCD
ncbi:MAG: hypothetical protein ACREE9_02560 [Stellaceae bacterium]